MELDLAEVAKEMEGIDVDKSKLQGKTQPESATVEGDVFLSSMSD